MSPPRAAGSEAMAAAGPMTGAAASRATTAARWSGESKVEAVRGAVQGAAGVKPPVAAAPILLWLCPPGPPVLLDPLPSRALCPPGPPALLGPPVPPALLGPLPSWTPCPPGPPVCGPCSSPPSLTHDWTPRSAAGVWALGVLWASRCLGTITGSRAHTSLCFQNTLEGPCILMSPLSPRWFSGMEKAPCPPLEPCSRADETPARPAEHYSRMKESQRKRQMCWPVNSLISNVNQIQAHDISLFSRARPHRAVTRPAGHTQLIEK
nr:carbohydrate-responsive element-binding protein-like isoform X3 [Gorilla gorilla gorilla]